MANLYSIFPSLEQSDNQDINQISTYSPKSLYKELKISTHSSPSPKSIHKDLKNSSYPSHETFHKDVKNSNLYSIFPSLEQIDINQELKQIPTESSKDSPKSIDKNLKNSPSLSHKAIQKDLQDKTNQSIKPLPSTTQKNLESLVPTETLPITNYSNPFNILLSQIEISSLHLVDDTWQMIYFEESDSLKDAVKVLNQKKLLSAPVSNSTGLCVGSLNVLDLLFYILTNELKKEPAVLFEEKSRKFLNFMDVESKMKEKKRISISVKDVLDYFSKSTLHTTPLTTSLYEATQYFIDNNCHRSLVINPIGQVFGIVSETDVIRCLSHFIQTVSDDLPKPGPISSFHDDIADYEKSIMKNQFLYDHFISILSLYKIKISSEHIPDIITKLQQLSHKKISTLLSFCPLIYISPKATVKEALLRLFSENRSAIGIVEDSNGEFLGDFSIDHMRGILMTHKRSCIFFNTIYDFLGLHSSSHQHRLHDIVVPLDITLGETIVKFSQYRTDIKHFNEDISQINNDNNNIYDITHSTPKPHMVGSNVHQLWMLNAKKGPARMIGLADILKIITSNSLS